MWTPRTECSSKGPEGSGLRMSKEEVGWTQWPPCRKCRCLAPDLVVGTRISSV